MKIKYARWQLSNVSGISNRFSMFLLMHHGDVLPNWARIAYYNYAGIWL